MATAYDLAPQTDPIWDAWLAQDSYRRDRAKANAALRSQQADQDYADALTKLAQQSNTANQNLSTNLLARGVYTSGEAGTRRDELLNTLAQARVAADNAYVSNKGRIAADQQSALDTLDFEREREIAASRERLAEKARRDAAAATAATLVNAATTPEQFSTITSTPAATLPRSTATWSPAPTREANFRASNDSGLGYSTAGRGSMAGLDAITSPPPPKKPKASNESGAGYSTASARPPKPSPLKPYQGPR